RGAGRDRFDDAGEVPRSEHVVDDDLERPRRQERRGDGHGPEEIPGRHRPAVGPEVGPERPDHLANGRVSNGRVHEPGLPWLRRQNRSGRPPGPRWLPAPTPICGEDAARRTPGPGFSAWAPVHDPFKARNVMSSCCGAAPTKASRSAKTASTIAPTGWWRTAARQVVSRSTPYSSSAAFHASDTPS